MEADGAPSTSIAQLTAQIVAAYAGNNQMDRAALPELLASVMNGLMQVSAGAPEPVVEQAPLPAVPIRKSVTDDFIVCLEDGKKFKSLKRHLATHYDLTPEAYRTKWKLPTDYPMVAPNYAAARSALALAAGLGRKPKAATAEDARPEPEPEAAAEPAPKRRASRRVKEAS